MSRRTKLTPARQRELIGALRVGNFIETSCAYVGITPQTFYNWMNRGEAEASRLEENPKGRVRKSEKIYFDFFEAATRALVEAEMRNVGILQRAAQGDEDTDPDWRAAMEYLKRGPPGKRWYRNELKVSGDVEVTHNVHVYVPDNGRGDGSALPVQRQPKRLQPGRVLDVVGDD